MYTGNQKGACFAGNENVRSQNINSFCNKANQVWSPLVSEWGSPDNTQWCLPCCFLAGNNQSSLLILYTWCLTVNIFLTTLKCKQCWRRKADSPSAKLSPLLEWEIPCLGPYWEGNLATTENSFVCCFLTWLPLCILHSQHKAWVFQLSFFPSFKIEHTQKGAHRF